MSNIQQVRRTSLEKQDTPKGAWRTPPQDITLRLGAAPGGLSAIRTVGSTEEPPRLVGQDRLGDSGVTCTKGRQGWQPLVCQDVAKKEDKPPLTRLSWDV